MSRRADPTLIARRGALSVERDPHRPTGRLLRQDDMDASYVDLADATYVEFDYLRWMRVVLQAAGARRVVHVGGAAAALARALAAADREGRHDVIEVDEDVLALAREHLGLRRSPGLRVRLGDGRAHLETRDTGSADAVVVDAFVGARVPRHLVSAEALATAAAVAPLTLVNVVDDRARAEVLPIAAGLAAAYPMVVALGARGLGRGNTVLVGSRLALPLDRIAARVAGDPSPALLTGARDLARLTKGTAAWRDP